MPATSSATPYVVAAYALIWLGLLAYVGWIALRMRGVRTELETVRELLEEREGPHPQPLTSMETTGE